MLTTRYQIEKYSSIFKFLAELNQTMNTNIKSTFLFKYRNENICLNLEVGSMMHNCNSSTQEAEARRLVVLGEPNPHSETLSEWIYSTIYAYILSFYFRVIMNTIV